MKKNTRDRLLRIKEPEAPSVSTDYLNALSFSAPTQVVRSFMQTRSAVLIALVKGGYTVRWRRGKETGSLAASAGDVVLWLPGTHRDEECPPSRPMKAFCISFNWHNPPASLTPLVSDRQGLIRLLSETILSAKGMTDPLRTTLLQAYLTASVGEYLRLAALTTSPLAIRVAQYTENHLREPLTLKTLAQAMGLETGYFARRYKATVGRTPMSDVRRIKVEHARGILRSEPWMPLKDVATRIGVISMQQMCRLFKTYFGLTARDLRVGLSRDSAPGQPPPKK